MRIIKIEGEINGVKYSVKPESIKGYIIEKELSQMMADWQEENNKPWKEFYGKNKEATESSDFTNLKDIPDFNIWQMDEEFRAEYAKKKALACMEFEKEPSDEFWKSDDLEIGVIHEAWDFFMGKQIPQSVSIR